jgi:hypothetical protein
LNYETPNNHVGGTECGAKEQQIKADISDAVENNL